MHVLVKVVGFSVDERHAIQTLLHLSEDGDVRFKLWKPEDGLAPNVFLLDADSHETAMEVQSPAFTPQTQSIVVGEGIRIDRAWRVFKRPLNWADVLRELELLFGTEQADIEIHTPEDDVRVSSSKVAPGYKTALIIGLSREHQLYLKARLALQGIVHVVEANDAGQAAQYLGEQQQGFGIVIVSEHLPDADTAALINALRSHTNAPHAIIVIPDQADCATLQKIENWGGTGVLELPFLPQQVRKMFARI